MSVRPARTGREAEMRNPAAYTARCGPIRPSLGHMRALALIPLVTCDRIRFRLSRVRLQPGQEVLRLHLNETAAIGPPVGWPTRPSPQHQKDSVRSHVRIWNPFDQRADSQGERQPWDSEGER